jgi:hypothetical protein
MGLFFDFFYFGAANGALIELATADGAFWQNKPNVPVLAKRTQLPAAIWIASSCSLFGSCHARI